MNPTERFYFDERTQEILEHLTIPFAVYQYIDKRVVTVALSQGFCTEFGFKKLEDAYHAMDNDMYRATHPDDKTRVADAAYRFAAFDIPYDIVYRTRTLKDPDYIILHAYGRSIYPEQGVRLCLTWYAYEGLFSPEQGTYESVLNHTLSRFLTEESQYRGMYYDYMTGLPNMAYFYELAEAGRKSMKEHHQPSAVLFFDLTGLKQFNWRYGFAEGDRLICAVAAILAKHFSNENCARLAQDHFAAFAPEEGLKERLDAVIRECAVANDGKTLPLRIGVYPDRIEAVEIGTACDRAKLAANSQKKRKDSYCSFFNLDMLTEEKNRQEIITNLDKAIEEGWIKVYYQPIVRSSSGKVCDLEALARWDDPVRGMLPPSAFIPVLEDTTLIHKLDLCVVRQVLRHLKASEKKGLQCLPVSINFSRADFDACDLVHELCAMVDEAGVSHRLIHVEITESMLGSDFDYMKEQISHFRSHGFQVWMDDFGSGYSSLDVLQSIQFDLIKFDMGFMKRLNEGDKGKIILTEMMKMATSLGVDTICEGVETQSQVRFLQEIGCSKLQGYYFMKPVPLEQILKRYTVDTQNGFENPEESDYYDTMGRVNLYDLSFLANMDDSVIKNTFDTVPMGVMEVNRDGNHVRYVRSNQSYRDFMKRAFGFDLSDPAREYPVPAAGPGSSFMRAFERCQSNGNRAFVDEVVMDGSTVRSFLRIIAENPVTGWVSVAVAVLSITGPNIQRQQEEEEQLQQEKTALGRIAALSPDYLVLYTIDPLTGHYTQYSPSNEFEMFGLERQGEDFFADVRTDSPKAIAPEDIERHLRVLTKENMMREIRKKGFFVHNYGLLLNGETVPVRLKATLTREGGREMILLGVNKVANPPAEMSREYLELLQENEQLKKEAAVIRKIAELKESVSSLLTNMPGLTFSKDVATGRYMACNQAFAEYANKETPEGVVGLTDFEIFDRETAAHFAQDDQKALSMDTPYVFFEDVLDGAGQRRQFQTTKLKFIDSAGRQCLLGLCQDMTDAMRYQRENASAREACKEARDNSSIYARLQALTGNYLCVYVADPESGRYREFNASDHYEERFAQAKEGTDFFSSLRSATREYIHPDDHKRVLSFLTKENILSEVERSGIFTLTYRLMADGNPFYVQMKAAMVEESEGQRLVVILSDIDAQVRQEEETARRLAQAQARANIDALTGVKNKHAFLDAATRLDRQIANHRQSPFAIVMLDVNDLKQVNDSQGHQAGDQYLRDACRIICDIFKHSPVFRVGGDEFAVIVQDVDYECMEERLDSMQRHNDAALQSGGIVIACGVAKHEDEASVASVTERADQAMYENKNALKAR